MAEEQVAGNVAARETHISRLFFTPDRAHKFLKPVETGFLDHRTTESRIDALNRELDLNRRLSPDIYLGVSEVHEQGAVVDAMLTMRRLPDERRLTALVGTDEFEPALRAVAKTIAAFHESLDPVTEGSPMGDAEGLLELWASSFSDMAPDAGAVIDAAEFDRVEALARAYLDHAGPLFARRREEGLVRDGHGDLTAEDIFILPDGPRILDCLAFSDDLRISDVLADISFLVMDVHRLAGIGPAQRLMAWYCEFTGEHHPASLAHHYVAYRAHIRAKVELLRHRQGTAEAAERARAYHALALDHLVRAQLRVVVVGGGPGTGKTTVAHEIGQRTGWVVLSSDELRKDLAKVDHESHGHDAPGEGLYDRSVTTQTYEQLVAHADAALRAGTSVVLDASWADAAHRAAAAELAQRHGAALVELRCVLPPDEAKRRVRDRLAGGHDASDARAEIVDYLGERFHDWPSASVVDTSTPPAVAGEHAATIASRVRASPRR